MPPRPTPSKYLLHEGRKEGMRTDEEVIEWGHPLAVEAEAMVLRQG